MASDFCSAISCLFNVSIWGSIGEWAQAVIAGIVCYATIWAMFRGTRKAADLQKSVEHQKVLDNTFNLVQTVLYITEAINAAVQHDKPSADASTPTTVRKIYDIGSRELFMDYQRRFSAWEMPLFEKPELNKALLDLEFHVSKFFSYVIAFQENIAVNNFPVPYPEDSINIALAGASSKDIQKMMLENSKTRARHQTTSCNSVEIQFNAVRKCVDTIKSHLKADAL